MKAKNPVFPELRAYDKIPDSKCPKCGEEVLYKGEKEALGYHEVMWGCCDCEIEGGWYEN